MSFLVVSEFRVFLICEYLSFFNLGLLFIDCAVVASDSEKHHRLSIVVTFVVY